MSKNGQAAAFYDLEGTLVSTNLVHTLGFYATRQQGLWQTLKMSAGTLAKLPFFAATDLYSRNVFNELRGFIRRPAALFLGRAFRRSLKTGDLPGHEGADRAE